MNHDRPCPCGSEKPSRWYKDARGIELFRGCDSCAPKKLAGYRPEVLTDPNYEASEQIEPDEEELYRIADQKIQCMIDDVDGDRWYDIDSKRW